MSDHNLTPEQRALPEKSRRKAYIRLPMTCDLVREILDEAAGKIITEFRIPGEEYAFVDAAVSQAFLRIRDEVTQPFRTEQMKLLTPDDSAAFVQEMGYRETPYGHVEYIRIYTNNYRQLTWDEVWEKFKDSYPDQWAVQCFPPGDKLVNDTNIYHLFVLDEPPRGMSIHPSDWEVDHVV